MKDVAKQPLILFYNTFFDIPFNLSHLEAEVRNCYVFDRSLYERADAVVFHFPDLTFGVPTLEDVDRLEKPHGQLWVAWSIESAVNYPVLNDAAFMSKFDWTMGYRRTAEFWTPYCPDRSVWAEALTRSLPAKTEKAPVAMFQSAADNKSRRIEFAEDLMRTIQVDSFGRVLNNRSLPGPDRGGETKLDTIARYKFCLSFENAMEEDYVTEKLYDPLRVGTVPVYRGAPNVEDFAPGDRCYINAGDFPTPRALAEYLVHLDNNAEEYAAFFSWRARPLRARFELEFLQPRPDPFASLVDAVTRRLSNSCS